MPASAPATRRSRTTTSLRARDQSSADSAALLAATLGRLTREERERVVANRYRSWRVSIQKMMRLAVVAALGCCVALAPRRLVQPPRHRVVCEGTSVLATAAEALLALGASYRRPYNSLSLRWTAKQYVTLKFCGVGRHKPRRSFGRTVFGCALQFPSNTSDLFQTSVAAESIAKTRVTPIHELAKKRTNRRRNAVRASS